MDILRRAVAALRAQRAPPPPPDFTFHHPQPIRRAVIPWLEP